MTVVYIILILITIFLCSHLTNVLKIWSVISPLERARVFYVTATYITIYLLLCIGAGLLK